MGGSNCGARVGEEDEVQSNAESEEGGEGAKGLVKWWTRSALWRRLRKTTSE